MTLTPQMTSSISIIIPTLNEATNLPELLPAAKKVKELLVVDGGSNDNTLLVAKELGYGIIEETGAGGRGTQLNTGAANASGSILLFLHADTHLPLDFPHAVSTCLANSENILGSFRLQVNNSDILLSLVLLFTNIRSKFLQLPYGDQSLFIRKKDFLKLGGFPEVPIMEDYIFVKRAKKKGKIVTLDQAVTTSARRWKRLGVLQTTVTNQLVVLGYYLGIKPEKLAAFYRRK